jgi:hypothetical protein
MTGHIANYLQKINLGYSVQGAVSSPSPPPASRAARERREGSREQLSDSQGVEEREGRGESVPAGLLESF